MSLTNASAGGLAIGACLAAASAMAQSWQPAPDFPVDVPPGRVWASGLVYQGKIVAIGGTPWIGGDEDGSVHTLDPDYTGDWLEATPLEGLGPIVGQGAGIDDLGRMVVFGGVSAVDPEEPGQNKVYDLVEGPQDTIAARGAEAPMAYFAVATDPAGRVYALGGGPGASATPATPNSAYAERYVGSTNTWQPIAPMPSGVADAAAVYDGRGHLLVLGGYVAGGGARTSNVAQYDIASDAWSDVAVPDLPVALTGLRAVLGANGLVYALGGVSGPVGAGTVQNATWVLDPGANLWSAGPGMLTAREHFAVVLAEDSHLYALGGEGGGGGIALVEKLYTPVCPVFGPCEAYVPTWPGQRVALAAAATGGAPITYRWRKDGAPLADGPTGSGSTIEGATTPTLTIADVGPADEGSYDAVATNDCGSAASDPSVLALFVPPATDVPWEATGLHPTWAEQSHATAAEGPSQAGYGVRDTGDYNDIALACEWSGTPTTTTYAGPDSVGGAFHDRAGGLRVGFWWWPYPCYIGGQWYTCYSSQASLVDANDAFVNLQVSGWEYSGANGTDGKQIVGTASTDDEVGNYFHAAVLWNRNAIGNWSYTFLTWPYGAPNRDGFGGAAYAGHQYGHWRYRGVAYDGNHAARWSDTSDSLVGMEPAGSSSSRIEAAHIGQQGGVATWAGGDHATVWSGSAESALDIHPAGWMSSEIDDVHTGVQVGSVSGPGIHAAIWSGTAASFVDLHAFLPPTFASSSAAGVHVDARRRITVVGTGYNTGTGRTEALLWRAGPETPVCDGEEQDCEDGIDGDCDGWIDCLDPDCCAALACDGPDTDGDGYALCDCDATDPEIWSVPAEATQLALEHDAIQGTLLAWSPTASPGAETVRYEVLRAVDPGSFLTGTTCVPDGDATDTSVIDAEAPAAGHAWFYLVRAANDCTGGDGSLGRDSGGVPRAGRSCS